MSVPHPAAPSPLPAYALGLGITFALAALAGVALAPGCSAKACTSTSLTGEPSPALDCPAGSLCYLGECIRACSAGQERAEKCQTSSDCPAARPTCVSGLCSACESGELCVPTLNVCRPVAEVLLPDPPPMPGPGPRPPAPLDGGPLDGGLYPFPGVKPSRDAGDDMPAVETDFTRAGYVDVAETLDLRGGGSVAGREVSVRAFDVSGNGPGLRWRADVDPPSVERQVEELGDCTLRSLTATAAVTPRVADVGVVRIDSHPEFPGSIAARLEATFSPGVGYRVVPAPGASPLLVFSGTPAPDDIRYLAVTSAGLASVTMGGWPSGAASTFVGHQVPFRMEPSTATLALLSAPVIVANPPRADLNLTWRPVDSGNDGKTRVHVRVPGPGAEITCAVSEGAQRAPSITIRSDLLRAFRAATGVARAPIFLERASTVRLQVAPAEGQRIDLSVRVRHSLIGELVLE